MAALACALALGACGGEGDGGGPIPRDAGDQILAQLEDVEEQVEAGECDAAAATAEAIANEIESLPANVDGELRETLVTASGQLEAQTRDPEQCEPPPPPPPPTGGTGAAGVLEEGEE